MSKTVFDALLQEFPHAKMTDPDYVDPIEAVSEDESLPDGRLSQGNPGTDYQEAAGQLLDSAPLLTINTTSGSYITLACYRLSGATWSYWLGSQLYAGIQSGDQFFTVGTVNMDLLCHGLSCPKSFFKGHGPVYREREFFLHRMDECGTELVYDISSTGALINGTRTSSNCIYEVPYDRILDMGYTDFSISLTQSGGYVSFDSSVALIVQEKKTNVFYGTNSLQCFDVYIPSGYTYNAGSPTKYPAVVLLHGGGWSGGDKGNMIDNNYNYPAAITSRGCICVNMNYRLSTTCQNMLNDIQGVLDALRTKHSDCIVATKAALWGYSAGGHLGASVCISPEYGHFSDQTGDF